MLPRSIDLNADLGEGGGHDIELMAIINSANIACGGHAGDAHTMRATIEEAIAAGVAVGAHPGYEDRANFGRMPIDLDPGDVHDLVSRQLDRLLAIHPALHHVKPHGALYHRANSDARTADAILMAMTSLTPEAILYAPPTGELSRAAARHGILHWAEGFIDRTYQADGSLTPRSSPGAVIHDPQLAVAQAMEIARHQSVTTTAGTRIALPARTLCVHGDSPVALTILRRVREALDR